MINGLDQRVDIIFAKLLWLPFAWYERASFCLWASEYSGAREYRVLTPIAFWYILIFNLATRIAFGKELRNADNDNSWT